MLNRLFVIFPIVSFIAFLSFKSFNSNESMVGSSEVIENEIAVINPIPNPRKNIKKSPANYVSIEKIDRARKHIIVKASLKKISKKVENNTNLRNSVSEVELNSVVFSNNVEKSEIKQKNNVKKYEENLKKSVVLDLKDRKKPTKWVEHLSGADALIIAKKQNKNECDKSIEACSNLMEKTDLSLVGVVVKSDNEYKNHKLKDFKGRVDQGNFAENTPALYVE